MESTPKRTALLALVRELDDDVDTVVAYLREKRAVLTGNFRTKEHELVAQLGNPTPAVSGPTEPATREQRADA